MNRVILPADRTSACLKLPRSREKPSGYYHLLLGDYGLGAMYPPYGERWHLVIFNPCGMPYTDSQWKIMRYEE